MTLRGRAIVPGMLGVLLLAGACGEDPPPRAQTASDERPPREADASREVVESGQDPRPRVYAASRELQPLEADEVREVLESGEGPIVIDVRPARARARGYIPGTEHFYSKHIQWRFDELRPYAERGIVVYDEGGLNARRAGLKLLNEGFPKVFILKGHLPAWRARGYPLEAPPEDGSPEE